MLQPLLDHAATFVRSLLPWHAEFNASALAFTGAYMLAQVTFCLALRRMAMAIPGPQRMCSPVGLWVLVIPGAGALGSFGVLRHVWDAATAATRAHHVDPPRGVALVRREVAAHTGRCRGMRPPRAAEPKALQH